MNILERISELCKVHNINGTKLGELLGLKKSPMTDWKNGKARPTVEQIEKMCEIFATSADYLIFGNDKSSITPEEQELLEAYRNADPGMKAAARKLLDAPEPTGKSSNWMTEEKAI